jgi:hypothetical protein
MAWEIPILQQIVVVRPEWPWSDQNGSPEWQTGGKYRQEGRITMKAVFILVTALALAPLAALPAFAATAHAVDFATLDGKVLLGYQGWFNCPGDGDTNRGWRSWARGTPSAETLTVDMYPDLTEFNPSELCPVPGFTIRGRQAFLYSAMNSNVVDRHFLWMKNYSLDADGEDLPADWYLKLSGEITKRFHGEPGSPAFPLTFPKGRQ